MNEIERKPANTFAQPPATKQSRWLARASLSLILAAMLAALHAVGKSPAHAAAPPSPLRFEVSFAKDLSSAPLDGRMLVLLSTDATEEPRREISYDTGSQQVLGADVEALAPDAPARVDDSAVGYPVKKLAEIPPGDYYVQGLMNIYETFHRSDGRTVKLPMDHGEGQQWNLKPGNLYSKPEKIHFDPSAGVIRIRLTEKIPPIEPPQDTKYVKHFQMQSDLVTKFWGRPMELGAIVLVPEGFDEHPAAHYPLMVYQGHFAHDLFNTGFHTEPPPAGLQGRQLEFAQTQYRLAQDWISGRMPHMIVLEIQHANPYFDDSYAVNSANVGPYGDAIVHELIPAVEKKYRGIGQNWARALYGGSTGGWETLGVQVFYPDDFNGAYCFCPDPVDFRAYMSVNLYQDKNAFFDQGPWLDIARPAVRTPDDTILATMASMNQFEQALGSHGRSTEQFGIWQAVFGPVGDDGYPKAIWDPVTGAIDPKVADYFHEHYDLSHILQRDWGTLGPKLVGKIHVAVGTRDTYFLDNAVRLLQKFLDTTSNPNYAGDFEYGPHQPHCWTGGAGLTTSEAGKTVHQRTLEKAAAWMEKTAPPGADTTSWKY